MSLLQLTIEKYKYSQEANPILCDTYIPERKEWYKPFYPNGNSSFWQRMSNSVIHRWISIQFGYAHRLVKSRRFKGFI